MKQKDLFTKLLNIRAEESKPVFLMMVFSFFIGLSLTFYFTASNAIFLKHFPPKMIPVSFIASGIIVYLAWWIFSLIDKKSSLSRQVTFKFLFVFITVLAISIGVWAYDSSWLAFVMYTWVRVMVYISLVNFWGVAGKLFNIRQGKRIFGLISVGEVISIIIGYFSIPFILHFLKAPDLLFLASFSLFICLILVFIIFSTFKDQLNMVKVASAPVKTQVKSEWNYWNLLKKPYFLLISLMALLPIFSYLFVDFLFLAQTKREFANNPETIAKFLGIFLGAVAIVELLFKLVSGRILNKYGLKPSLLALPIIMVFGILLAAVSGTLYGTTGMFFAFIALARLFERSIRGAVYEPAFQLLYQPVPSEQRLPFQNQIEGIPKAMGTVITGVVILLLSSISIFSLVQFNYVFLLVLGFWIWIAWKMYLEYRNMIKTKLAESQHLEKQGAGSMVSLIRDTLAQAEPEKFQSLYELFEKIEPAGIESTLQSAYLTAPIAVKKAILKKIQERQFVPALTFIKGLMEQEMDTELKNLVEETKEILKSAEDMPFDSLVEDAASHEVTTRLRVARLLGYSGRYNTYKLLFSLLKDPDQRVRKAAIISSGKIKRFELWPLIIENLIIPEFASAARVAVRIVGEPILNDVDRFFEKIGEHRTARLKILQIYEAIGGDKVIRLLRDKIKYPDRDIRSQVLISLSSLEYHASVSEIPYIKQAIEESVETMVWLIACLLDIPPSPETMTLRNALLQEIEEKKENVFLLLSLLYETKTIQHIREHIESPDTNAKIYALEIGDMMISQDIKELFFPIFEDITMNERLNRFSIRFPQEEMSLIDRLCDIINMDYSKINRWVKACAIDLLGKTPSSEPEKCEEILAANVVNPDIMLSELAAWVLFNTSSSYYYDTLIRFEKKQSLVLANTFNTIKKRQNKDVSLFFENVIALKDSDFFNPVAEIEIVNLLMSIHAMKERSGQTPEVTIDKDERTLTFPSGDSDQLVVPLDYLFEILAGNPGLTERFIRLYYKKQ
ncbi:MAG: hypothetical protein ACOYM0_06995 [Bacteroidales bacterium]